MIEVKKLSFAYSKKKPLILKDISFKVEKGEVFGLLGPSGAGKSTLQKILLGLLKGHTGSAMVNGMDVKNIRRTYYDNIGVGFEYGEKRVCVETLSGVHEYSTHMLGQNKEFLAVLNKGIESISTKEASLEDIFTIVTGRLLV